MGLRDKKRPFGGLWSQLGEEEEMTEKGVSFESSRKALLVAASKNRKAVKKVVRFSNNDVPEFLSRLEEFEKHSKNARLVVK